MIFNFFKSKQQQLYDAIEANNLSKVKQLISHPKVNIMKRIRMGIDHFMKLLFGYILRHVSSASALPMLKYPQYFLLHLP